MARIKALTLWQPYATLIALGAKSIETRSWRTSYRGPLAIHAAARRDSVVWTLIKQHDVQRALRRCGYREPMPFGVVVAIAELVDVLPVEAVGSDNSEAQFGDYTPGRFAWMLANVQPLAEPVQAKGAQGLWNWDVLVKEMRK